MIQFKIDQLEKISEQHGLASEKITQQYPHISEFLNRIHARKQGFYEIPNLEETVKNIQSFKKNVEGKYDHLIILGIGGSALGTICLKQSLTPFFHQRSPQLHILDNIDPDFMAELERSIDLKKSLFIVVTKSGTTPETLAQYFYFRKKIKSAQLNPQEHFVFITDPVKGLLREISFKENIPSFEIPDNIGGRFSVLTAVGLLPAALIGLNIEELLRGAEEMKKNFLSTTGSENLPFQLATIQYLLTQKQKTITVLMPYAQHLFSFSDWYRQLLAESIGKAVNNKGDTINVGITPVNALGVTDQHSQSQLYNEGPNDKLLIFLKTEKFQQDLQIPEEELMPETQYLKGVSFTKLLHTELNGTIESLVQNDRPTITISIPEINEKYLGALFMLFEASIAFLGEYFDINAFDQPGVELSKILTRKKLQ